MTPSYYLSGPMTGIAEHNFPHFHTVAAALRLLGHTIVNPAEINVASAGDWHRCLRADIRALCDCTGIVMLAGWEASQGAQLELHIAHRLGLQVYPSVNAFLEEHGHDPL